MPVDASIPLQVNSIKLPDFLGIEAKKQDMELQRKDAEYKDKQRLDKDAGAKKKAATDSLNRVNQARKQAYDAYTAQGKKHEEAVSLAEQAGKARYDHELQWLLSQYPNTETKTYEQTLPIMDQLFKHQSEKLNIESKKGQNAIALVKEKGNQSRLTEKTKNKNNPASEYIKPDAQTVNMATAALTSALGNTPPEGAAEAMAGRILALTKSGMPYQQAIQQAGKEVMGNIQGEDGRFSSQSYNPLTPNTAPQQNAIAPPAQESKNYSGLWGSK